MPRNHKRKPRKSRTDRSPAAMVEQPGFIPLTSPALTIKHLTTAAPAQAAPPLRRAGRKSGGSASRRRTTG